MDLKQNLEDTTTKKSVSIGPNGLKTKDLQETQKLKKVLEKGPMDLGQKPSKNTKTSETIGKRFDGLRIKVKKSQKIEK